MDEATVPVLPLAAVSASFGVLATIASGSIGAHLQARREHARWLIQERMQAIIRAYAVVKGFQLNRSKLERIAEHDGSAPTDPEVQALLAQDDERYAATAEAFAPLVILGPCSVSEHLTALQKAYEANDRPAFFQAENDLIDSARRASKIPRG